MSDAVNEPMTIRLIAGLGNPGDEYEGTRHNIGFSVVERLLAKLPKGFERSHGYSSFYWTGNYAGRRLILQKPQTYMNLSGNAVAPLARAAGIAPEEILIVYDDMDMPLGRLRIRRDGGSGGHNGIKSLIEELGTEKFPRIRVGIGHGAGGHGGADFVLSHFEGAEAEICSNVLTGAADAVVLMLRRGISMAMNRFNSMDYAPEPAKPERDSETETATNK